jgi:hypothetical protein
MWVMTGESGRGNLQDKREERVALPLGIDKFDYLAQPLTQGFRSLDSGFCQIRVLRERRSDLTQFR